jgi:uncharacterized membrane protein YkvA (DUF1232 family)
MKFSIQAVYGWYRNLLRNPKYRWWAIIGTLVYLVSPIDIAPDFLPIVGQIDDVFLLTLLISEVSQVAIEGFKARKNSNLDANTPNPTETSNSGTDTIDVDAVSVK